ncbi:MAG: TonB-dependent receptor plug domain-containing protein, partial [Acidobacteriota bacterium]
MSHAVRMVSGCLLAAAAAAAAPATEESCAVAGTVRGKDRRPLAGVAVVATDGSATVSDAQGRYCLPRGGEPEVLTLVFEVPGFSTLEIPDLRLEPTAPRSLDVELTPSFLEEVVVTGTRTERRLSEAPVRTEVVPRSRIAEAQARTLADALELIPGAQVGSMCQNCNFNELRLLGLEGRYTQVLVDGQPILSWLAMVYGLEHIPARLIDQLEVVNIIPHQPTRNGYSV